MCFALFQTHGLGEIDWTPVDSLTAQKRLVEAGLGIALLSESNAAEELRHKTISTIGVGDLKASHDVVTVTRRGGFLSAAARRLLEIFAGNIDRPDLSVAFQLTPDEAASRFLPATVFQMATGGRYRLGHHFQP
jgi:hypothetical protein